MGGGGASCPGQDIFTTGVGGGGQAAQAKVPYPNPHFFLSKER